jgi:hypothetical protein
MPNCGHSDLHAASRIRQSSIESPVTLLIPRGEEPPKKRSGTVESTQVSLFQKCNNPPINQHQPTSTNTQLQMYQIVNSGFTKLDKSSPLAPRVNHKPRSPLVLLADREALRGDRIDSRSSWLMGWFDGKNVQENPVFSHQNLLFSCFLARARASRKFEGDRQCTTSIGDGLSS